MFDPKITVSHIITTILIAISGFMYVSDISRATEQNAADINLEKQLRQSEGNHVRESLDDLKSETKEIKKLINELIRQESLK